MAEIEMDWGASPPEADVPVEIPKYPDMSEEEFEILQARVLEYREKVLNKVEISPEEELEAAKFINIWFRQRRGVAMSCRTEKKAAVKKTTAGRSPRKPSAAKQAKAAADKVMADIFADVFSM